MRFNSLGLKKLIATSYRPSSIVGGQLPLFEIRGLKGLSVKEPFVIEINEVKDRTGDGAVGLPDVELLLKQEKNATHVLNGDDKYSAGDFRSKECVELLKQADVVVTNPPFSLFREYVAQLMEHDKQFLIIGSKNAITCKEIFKLVKKNKLWLGYGFANGNAYFSIPREYARDFASGVYDEKTGLVKFRNVGWMTNMNHSGRHEEIPLYKRYTPEQYQKYDNYDAIEVGKVAEIPVDYDGVMGVPITFLDKYNPDQFEILGITDRQNTSGLRTKKYREQDVGKRANDLNARSVLKVNDTYKAVYARLLIRKKS